MVEHTEVGSIPAEVSSNYNLQRKAIVLSYRSEPSPFIRFFSQKMND